MSPRPLQIQLGRNAARSLQEHGWRGRDIKLLMGASGGPKWLILGHLDRLLFDSFLMQERTAPLRAIGSSVGSWRHACLAQEKPSAAIQRFEDIYLNWEYSDKPRVAEISSASRQMLSHVLGEHGADAVAQNPWLHSYIVTARGRGLNSARNAGAIALGMGSSAIANTLHRQLLATQFQRVIFSSIGAQPLRLTDFATTHVELHAKLVKKALHASGSIPFLLSGERDIPGAPRGHYWDGGIIDYHFDMQQVDDEQLILYPHFRADLTPGWFDKLLPWRRHGTPRKENLILLSPSPDFIASLPGGKIPDRSDFSKMNPAQRVAIWRECVNRSRELAEDFAQQIAAKDPLKNTSLLAES